MTAFLTAIVASLLMAYIIVRVGKRRPVGTKLTWGEAMASGLFVFALLLMVYGVVPDRWLRYADGELRWRTDKIGIPMGPMGGFLHNVLGLGSSKNVIAPHGIKFFGHGRIILSANVLENIIVVVIYGVAIMGHILMIRWWQNRGKAPKAAELAKTSAYGRPLVRTGS